MNLSESLPADGSEIEIEVPDRITIAGLIGHLRVSREHLWMISVGSSVVQDEYVLKPLDRVTLFTHITGG